MMDPKALQDYLDRTPHADMFDVMFTFPELSMNEAHRAVRKRRFMRAIRRWWPVLIMIAAIVVIVLLHR